MVREAAELGELDVLIEQQAQFGRRVTLKNKWTNEQKNVYGLSTFFVVQCASVDCVNYWIAIVTQAYKKRAKWIASYTLVAHALLGEFKWLILRRIKVTLLLTLYDGDRSPYAAWQPLYWVEWTLSQADKRWCCGVVERRGESLTINTVTPSEQTRHPKLGFRQ